MNPRLMENNATSWTNAKPAQAGLLAGDLGDLYRPTDVLGAALPADDLTKAVGHRDGNPPGIGRGFGDSLDRA